MVEEKALRIFNRHMHVDDECPVCHQRGITWTPLNSVVATISAHITLHRSPFSGRRLADIDQWYNREFLPEYSRRVYALAERRIGLDIEAQVWAAQRGERRRLFRGMAVVLLGAGLITLRISYLLFFKARGDSFDSLTESRLFW